MSHSSADYVSYARGTTCRRSRPATKKKEELPLGGPALPEEPYWFCHWLTLDGRTSNIYLTLLGLQAFPGSRCFFHEANRRQKNHRPDHGVDDLRANASDENKPKPRQEPAGNEGADNADHDVAGEPEAVVLHELACEPAGNRTNNQPNDKTLNCHDHSPLEPTHAVSLLRFNESLVNGALRTQD